MEAIRVFVLMAGLTALFGAVGSVLGGTQGMWLALALASALEKLEAAAKRIPLRVNPAMAPLGQVDPLAAFGNGVTRLFATHPSTEERVARLRAMSASRVA